MCYVTLCYIETSQFLVISVRGTQKNSPENRMKLLSNEVILDWESEEI